MSDTLANDWRQRMAGRSALCAVLLAVPVAVAAQISFSAGLDSVPFGVSTFAAGPDTSSIGAAGAVAPNQNLSTLPGSTAAAGPAAAAVTGGTAGSAPSLGGTSDISDGGTIAPGPGGGPDDSGGGPDNPGGPVDPGPTPGPTPPPTPTPPTPEPPSASPPAQPSVPGVNLPDVGGVVDSVTAPVEQVTGGLLPGSRP